jgi:hypothetical protein
MEELGHIGILAQISQHLPSTVGLGVRYLG